MPHLMTKMLERHPKPVVAQALHLLNHQWAVAAKAAAKVCQPVKAVMRGWSLGSSACLNRFTSVLSASACKVSQISRVSSFRPCLGKKLSSDG